MLLICPPHSIHHRENMVITWNTEFSKLILNLLLVKMEHQCPSSYLHHLIHSWVQFGFCSEHVMSPRRRYNRPTLVLGLADQVLHPHVTRPNFSQHDLTRPHTSSVAPGTYGVNRKLFRNVRIYTVWEKDPK